ncbi:hypothetical protein CF15_00080 [Pyrodictium occultum]|uniref:PD-(D/E)XK endonuclease-like domain-containing protein n=1 Tax=Pyrodictium occultum TaxID=2309 RepID=A0A0V8RTA5_PYROC|nr:hypothetical protein [Pyrodictium occultum]KSW11308.1 hypothetical protein CF15_00080 [Pyrodictium occultum]
MPDGLEEVLENVRLVLEAVSKGEYCCLRFGLPYVTPGLLASQALCEKRLEYELLGEQEPGAKRASEARKLVEVLLEARRRIPPGAGSFTLSIPVAAVVEGVPVIGRPHAVHVRNGRVAAVVVGKISGRPGRLYPSDKVRLYAYALTLERAGFPMSSGTRLVLAAARDNRSLIALLSGLDLSRVRPVAGDGAALHVLAHDPDLELEMLAPLLAYWRGERQAAVRRGRWCASCPFRERCG